MPHSYSSQYREMVLAHVRSVVDVATELEVSAATVFRWQRQFGSTATYGWGSRPRIGRSYVRRRSASRSSKANSSRRDVRRSCSRKGGWFTQKALYPIVEALGAEGHGMKASCQLLRIAPSGFFMWRQRPPSARTIRRAWPTDVIHQIWDQSRQTYGWRRVRAELADAYRQIVNKKLDAVDHARTRNQWLHETAEGTTQPEEPGDDGRLRSTRLRKRWTEPVVDDRHHRTSNA
jgi:hypothetical protein